MRQALFALVGVVLGFLLGGVGPRQDLEAEREKVSRLQDELLKAERRSRGGGLGRSVLPGLDGMLGAPSGPDEDLDDPPGPEVDELDGTDEIAPSPPAPRRDGDWRSGEREEFELAVEAQRVRARQNRAALAEQADLSEAELEDFDRIVGDMNEDLALHAEELLDLALSGEEPSPREFLGISHDVTGILLESQVAMEELVGEEDMGRGEDPEGQIWNYLDLETFRPAVEEAIEAGAEAPVFDGGP